MTDLTAGTLEKMLEKLKPKARYTSQLHVEEYTDSIYKEIINGDIEISKNREEISKSPQKNDWEDILRKKILSKAERQKSELEQKLGFISNSINSLRKYDELKAAVRSPKAYMIDQSRVEEEQWRKKIEIRQEEIQKKKKLAQESKERKIEEEQQNEERRKAEEAEKKKNEILQHMKNIEDRMKKRQQFVKTGNQRYQRVKRQKSMYERLSQKFQQKQNSILEERKKRLAEIRNFHKPINQNDLKQHEERFLQLKRQKQEMRQRQRKMNESRSQSQSSYYQSQFYRQIADQTKNVEENYAQIKSQKMKQFSDHIRDHYVPKIDIQKKTQLEDLIESERNKEDIKLQKQKELLEKSKIKGMENLDFIRSLNKNKKSRVKETDTANKTARGEKISYQNYLTHRSADHSQPKQRWSRILGSSKDRESKAIQIQYQSQKLEEELRRKQKRTQYVTGSKEDKSKIDDQYFSMIKAKLQILKD